MSLVIELNNILEINKYKNESLIDTFIIGIEKLSLDSKLKLDVLKTKEVVKKIKKINKFVCLNCTKIFHENELEEVNNPMFFIKKGVATPNGLLSNEIFGMTKDDRQGTFAYIKLNGLFIDPSCYKQWCKALSCKCNDGNFKSG